MDHNDVGYGEQDTPATITAIANNPELFKGTLPQAYSIDSGDTEELRAQHDYTKSQLTTKPPVLPATERTKFQLPDNVTTQGIVPSNVSGNEDEDDTGASSDRKDQQRHHHQHPKEEEELIPVLPKDQDIAAAQVPMPIQPHNAGLCIGIDIDRSKASLPPPSDSSMGTVLWVHPQSPLVCCIVMQGYSKIRCVKCNCASMHGAPALQGGW